MSHIGRIAAGTLAKRGRRGGSSVSREFDIYCCCCWAMKSMEVCTSEAVAVGRAQNSWRGFDEEKTDKAAAGSQTTNKKREREEKREYKKMRRSSVSSWRRNDLCGSTGPLYLSLQGQRAAVK